MSYDEWNLRVDILGLNTTYDYVIRLMKEPTREQLAHLLMSGLFGRVMLCLGNRIIVNLADAGAAGKFVNDYYMDWIKEASDKLNASERREAERG